jgi:hypothetical protein
MMAQDPRYHHRARRPPALSAGRLRQWTVAIEDALSTRRIFAGSSIGESNVSPLRQRNPNRSRKGKWPRMTTNFHESGLNYRSAG